MILDMAPAPDDDDAWLRQVLQGLGALVVISLLVGGVIAAIALGAAKMTGLGQSSANGPVQQPSLYIPPGEPTTTPQVYPDPGRSQEPSPTASASTNPTEEPSPRKQSKAISLQAFPAQVAPGERINLTGVYPSGEGATLQVQRFENGWTDFPVSVSVSGGIFNTYVLTSRAGETRFRVYDKALQKASNPVRVRIG
jgi:hypothetical protein